MPNYVFYLIIYVNYKNSDVLFSAQLETIPTPILENKIS